MPRRKNRERDLRAQEAAYLRAQYGMSQDEIGRVLGRMFEGGKPMSQSQVSKLLDHAKRQKCFEESRRFIKTADISEERHEQIRGLLAPSSLRDALERVESATSVRVRSVRVLVSGLGADPTPELLDAALMRFARMAAGRVEELLRESDVFAVTWGRTIG